MNDVQNMWELTGPTSSDESGQTPSLVIGSIPPRRKNAENHGLELRVRAQARSKIRKAL